MESRYKKGIYAEWASVFFLMSKGYRLRARRFKTKLGEIDLVMTRGRQIVFVEVKARPDLTQGLEAISFKSQERIQRSAQIFCQLNPRFSDYVWRFDAVVVRPIRLPYHMKDAWRP